MIHVTPPPSDHRHVVPILAAIERHRLAHYDFGEAAMASDEVAIRQRGGDTSPGTLALLEAKRDAKDAVDEQAWREIFAVRPTTSGGLIALLRHLDTYHRSYDGMDREPDVFMALAEMVRELIPPPARPRPAAPPLHPASAWASLPAERRDTLGTMLVDLVFQDFLSGAAYAEEDRVVTDDAQRSAAIERAERLLNRIYDDVAAALPALFGPAGENPAWAEDYHAGRLTISNEGVVS